MSQKASFRQPGLCSKSEAHSRQKIQYICLQQTCQLNRLLCKSCINESHRKHKVGIIDKLIAPLNRLNMNSFHQQSYDDYLFFQEKIQIIEDEWEKLNIIFCKNMEQLKTGIIMQLTAVMKTFTNEQIDEAHQILMDGNSDLEVVNEYVKTINFLDKDYLEDVQDVKKFTNSITERVARSISKTAMKVDLLMKKMQDYIKEIDFNNFHQYNNRKAHEEDQSVKEQKNVEEKPEKNEEEQSASSTKRTTSASKKGKDQPQEVTKNPFSSSNIFTSTQRFCQAQVMNAIILTKIIAVQYYRNYEQFLFQYFSPY